MRKLTILFIALTLTAGLWAEDIPNNQIWYTTTDGGTVEFHSAYLFNVAVLSNTNTDGRGVITFEGDLEWIGQATFYKATTLESITFPASLRAIGNSAFAECAELKTINFNQGLDTINQSAFNKCSALTEIAIPASVRALKNSCFYECKNLRTIYVNWTEENQIPVVCAVSSELPDYPFIHEFAFSGIACQTDDCGRKNATLYVPVGTENLYYKSPYWSAFGTIKENLADVKPAAIAAIETAKEGVTNAHILAIANDAIEAITAATNSFQIGGIKTQTLADIEHAKAILNELPTDPEGTAGTVVTVTKDEKTLQLINPDKVSYGKQ